MTRRRRAPVYQGVEPLTAEDIADCILFALTRPLHVNVDEIVAQGARADERRPDRPQPVAAWR